MIRKSLIAAFIVFFGTAFVAMPVASANPLDDLIRFFTGDEMGEEDILDNSGDETGGEPGNETGDENGDESEGQPGDELEQESPPTDEEAVAEADLPESEPQEDSQHKSTNSGTQPQSASGKTSNAASGNGGQLPKTATPYPLMLLVGGLVMAAGLALLKVRPSRG